MDIYDYADTIFSKEDFEKFTKLLLIDFTDNKQEWENQNLEEYLSGIWGFVMGLEGYLNVKEGQDIKPTWKLFADILLAAIVYE